MKSKLIRITTVPISMNILLRNQLKFMSDYFEVIGVTSRDNKHFNEIAEREGIRIIDIGFTRTITPVKDFISLIKIWKLFLKEKPDIVHSHTPKAGLISMLAARLTNVPVRLHTIAGIQWIEASGFRKLLMSYTEKLTCYCATKVMPNSKGLFQWLLDNNICKADKLKFIANGSSNGIDLEYFHEKNTNDGLRKRSEIREKYNIKDQDIVFCFVGRLVKDKGIEELIEATLLLEESLGRMENSRQYILLLVGPIENGRDAISKEKMDLIFKYKNIRYVGRHDDIRPFLLASEIFVFPSYREGFPNALMQAGAMGLPSIVTDINGCNEIIIDNDNGLIIPPKDKVSLYNAMAFLIENDNIRIEMSSIARTMIEARFEQKLFWRELLEFYKAQ